jgi:hypothetical protein
MGWGMSSLLGLLGLRGKEVWLRDRGDALYFYVQIMNKEFLFYYWLLIRITYELK